LRILLIQRIADLSNILARIVDLACNLGRILDCDFIVELLADSNLGKTIVGLRILLQIWADRRICIPLFTSTVVGHVHAPIAPGSAAPERHLTMIGFAKFSPVYLILLIELKARMTLCSKETSIYISK
jgi:hypothetical protein